MSTFWWRLKRSQGITKAISIYALWIYVYQIYWQVWWKKQNVTIIRGNLPVGTSNLCRFTHQMLLIFWSEPKWLHKQNLAPKKRIPTKLSTWLTKITIPPNPHEHENQNSLPLSFLQSLSLKGPQCDIRAYPPRKKLFSWKSLLVLKSSCVYPSNHNCGLFLLCMQLQPRLTNCC